MKIRIFIWRLVQDRLSMVGRIRRFNPAVSRKCLLWRAEMVTSQYMFIHCGIISTVWPAIFKTMGLIWRQPSSIMEFIVGWRNLIPCREDSSTWTMLLVAVMWAIRKERDTRIFNQEFKSPFQIIGRHSINIIRDWKICKVGEWG